MRVIALLIAVFVAGFAVAKPPSTQPTQFLRFVENHDGSARLEVSETAYKNADGVVVHLIGAVHIADAEYYRGLNESFNHYDALLYEMVRPPLPERSPSDVIPPDTEVRQEPAQKRDPETAAERPNRTIRITGGLQRFLRDRLDLEFQMDAIDYEGRPNFVHADLDIDRFARMQAERGESMVSLMLRAAMADMDEAAARRANAHGLALIGALFSPDQSRELKRVLAAQFADLDVMTEAMEGSNGSVILTERNKVAINVLEREIANGKRYLGVFYGAAHLKGMEQLLMEMGFQKIGQTWRTAWEISPPAQRSTTRPAQK